MKGTKYPLMNIVSTSMQHHVWFCIVFVQGLNNVLQKKKGIQ